MATPNTFIELNGVAGEVIQVIKTLPGYSNSQIAVFGGLAVWRYRPHGRKTKDIDIIITEPLDTPGDDGCRRNSVRNSLLGLHRSNFVEHGPYLIYNSSLGYVVKIDIFLSWQSAYTPSGLELLNTIENGHVPYIAMTDLIIFKIYSCGLRHEKREQRCDAVDAQALLVQQMQSGPLDLTLQQEKAARAGLRDVLPWSSLGRIWWNFHLGL